MNATEFLDTNVYQTLLLRKDGSLNFTGKTYAEM